MAGLAQVPAIGWRRLDLEQNDKAITPIGNTFRKLAVMELLCRNRTPLTAEPQHTLLAEEKTIRRDHAMVERQRVLYCRID
jgi:hypothetical protein